MKTLLERINEAVITLAEESVKIERTGFIQLWQLKNGMSYLSNWDAKRIPEYIESQKSLGYTEDDMSVEAWLGTSNAWYSYISATVRNVKNGSSYRFSNNIVFVGRHELTKTQLEEAESPGLKIIQQHRETYLNNKENAIDFIKKGLFYQNNLGEMMFDQETHDFILSVSNDIEANKKAAIEASRNKFIAWAEENGSELLKLRIKYGQNWQNLAATEWAIAHTTGFQIWSDGEESEEWLVKNGSLEQLKELERAIAENPDHEIDMIRCKFKNDNYNYPEETDYFHKTYLRINVKTPVSYLPLFREIEDVDNE